MVARKLQSSGFGVWTARLQKYDGVKSPGGESLDSGSARLTLLGYYFLEADINNKRCWGH